MKKTHFTDEFVDIINNDNTINEDDKNKVLINLAKLKDTKVNILITGATGCGKSSTINALFKSNDAKVGQGVEPETMVITKYEMNNIVIYDSAGLGDGKEADRTHSKNIIEKLYEKDKEGNVLIDLVLVILDGSTRDLGTSFELINNVIIPNLGEDKKRLLIAINRSDVAMSGRGWDHESNKPNEKLIAFLDDKVASTKKRIKEATNVDVNPIYYAAGYKDGDEEQKPYNLSKLLAFILRHTKPEKRAVFIQDVNNDTDMWEDDDELEDYRGEIRSSMMKSIISSAAKGASIGANIGSALGGSAGRAVGRVIGAGVGAAVGFVASFF